MSLTTLVVIATTALAPAASELTPTQEADAQVELQAIRSEIASLREQCLNSASWLTQERAEQIRAVVRDVLADTTTRESLQSVHPTAGWDNGIFLESPDASFKLFIRGSEQVRFTYDHRPSVLGVTPSGSQDTWGSEIRRLKITLEGHVIDPTWKYKVELVFPAGQTVLDDAYLEKELAKGLNLRAGQFKVPFLREFLISDTNMLMVDRSSIESFFSASRAQGVQLQWLQGDLQLSAAAVNAIQVKSNYFSSGNTKNIPWDSQVVADYAFAARAEWKAAGSWAQLKDQTAWIGDEFGVLFGVAGEVEKKANNQGVPAMYGDLEPFVMSATADVLFQFSGANIFAFGVWRVVDPGQDGLADANQFGIVVQGGYFVNEKVELTARYEYGDADSNPNDIPATLNTLNGNGYSIFNAVTVGANWYIHKQRVKVSGDIGYAFDGVGAFAKNGNGFLADGTSASGEFDEGGQVVAKLQLQVLW